LLLYSLKLYYASLWFALILIGLVHGLVFLPVLLSQFGGSGYSSGDDEAEVSRRLQRAQDSAEFRPFATDVEAEDLEDEYY
jgi:Niemann-Pick C1 protein